MSFREDPSSRRLVNKRWGCWSFSETQLHGVARFSICFATPWKTGERGAHRMAEAERPQKRGSGFLRLFERGVDTATRNNVTAYGYSVSITATFALLQTSRSDTGL